MSKCIKFLSLLMGRVLPFALQVSEASFWVRGSKSKLNRNSAKNKRLIKAQVKSHLIL